MKFSASMMKTFHKCSLQAKFNYIDKIPQQTGSAAWFGSIIHSALELMGNGGTLEDALKQFNYDINASEPDYWNRRSSYTQYKDQGQNMLTDFAYKDRWTENNIIASEHKFMIDIGDHQLRGIVDALSFPKDVSSLDIIDWKTGSRPTNDNLRLDVQFTAYEYASYQKEFWCGYPGNEDKYPGMINGEELWERFKDIPRKTIWYDLKKNQDVIIPPHNDLDYGRLYRSMEQISRAVDLEVFVPNISGDSCSWCSYQEICPVYFDPIDKAH